MLNPMNATNLTVAWEQFESGAPVEPDLIRPEILASWERSRAYGVPRGVKKSVISQAALRQRIGMRRDLYDIALPIMESVSDFTTGSQFLSSLTDEEGYILKIFGEGDIVRLGLEEILMVEGGNRSERQVGTNAIGTTLVIKKPLQLCAEEHYYPLNTRWICSAAPIFDFEGKVMAVFCLTGLKETVSYHTLGMAVAVAQSISQQLIIQKNYTHIECAQHRMEVIIETVESGILLVDEEMKVSQLNSRAADLLMLPKEKIQQRSIKEVLPAKIFSTGVRRKEAEENVIMQRGAEQLHFAVNMRMSNTNEMVVTFEKAEALHKKIRRVIGSEAYFTFNDIIGESSALRNAIALAKIAADTDSRVLLSGESGTGKELFAQAIHNVSSYRRGPFLAINCGALPRSLIESELFGYESGAFTGARSGGAAGKFELANGGTIFLDEIGDMPIDVQATLLRVLQNKEVSRLGGSKPVPINVRVIAATNKNLLEAIMGNTFRSDLYYRLNVFNIHIPSLRERGGDIRILADYFFHKYKQAVQKNIEGFSEDAYLTLERHDWHGNVRELENVVEQSVYIAPGGMIGSECLRQLVSTGTAVTRFGLHARASRQEGPFQPSRDDTPADYDEKERMEMVLATVRGNAKKAATRLGMSRSTLYRKMASYGIDCKQYRYRPSSHREL